MTPFDESFGRDPFENIVREFFGSNRKQVREDSFIRNESDERNTDYVEDENYIYLIFELPGFNEKDIMISIEENKLNVVVGKKLSDCDNERVQGYLIEKLSRETIITKTLPRFISKKNFKHTMRNGILEIRFSKN